MEALIKKYALGTSSLLPILPDGEPEGWLADTNREVLKRLIRPEFRLVVDGGSWKGCSAYFMCKCHPSCKVVCIDSWKGSPEHQSRSDLPELFEQFKANMSIFSYRILAIRDDWRKGIWELIENDVSPDLIYIDWQHEYDDVRSQLELIVPAFPDAVICGDDFNKPGVNRAVREYADRFQLALKDNVTIWWFEKHNL